MIDVTARDMDSAVVNLTFFYKKTVHESVLFLFWYFAFLMSCFSDTSFFLIYIGFLAVTETHSP